MTMSMKNVDLNDFCTWSHSVSDLRFLVVTSQEAAHISRRRIKILSRNEIYYSDQTWRKILLEN